MAKPKLLNTLDDIDQRFGDMDVTFEEVKGLTDKQKVKRRSQMKEVAALKLEQQASARVPNGVLFGDDFATNFGMTRDDTKTFIVGTTSAGATLVTVNSSVGFVVGQEVTVYDDVNQEDVVISGIVGNTITVSALHFAYKEKAGFARTNSNGADVGAWLTSASYSVTDSTVVASAYDTTGNGGRKLARLNNGTLYTAIKASTTLHKVYKSINNGTTWTEIYSASLTAGLGDLALVTNGIYPYLIYSSSNTTVTVFGFKADDTIFTPSSIDSGQTGIGNVSIAINEAKTELHAAWSAGSKSVIRYSKGVISNDGSVSWDAVQIAASWPSADQHCTKPSIVVNSDGKPLILFKFHNTTVSTAGYIFSALLLPAGTWNKPVVDGSDTYTQSDPSAIFVPQSVNGLANGRIWAAWHGKDSLDASRENIRVSYSDDGGVTWSAITKLTTGNTVAQYNPIITANKNNEVFLLWWGDSPNVAGSYTQIRKIKHDGTSWGTITDVTTSQGASSSYPSTLCDSTLYFGEPLFIYKALTKIGFYGTWTAESTAPLAKSRTRYTLSPAQEIALFAGKDTDLTIDVHVDGAAPIKTTSANEDQFIYQGTIKKPRELKITLTKPTAANPAKLRYIVGGRG
jgi:hypothetical protein